MIVLLVILVVLVGLSAPIYPYSPRMGYRPFAFLAVVLACLVVWQLLGGGHHLTLRF